MGYQEIDKENQSCLKRILTSPQAYLEAKKRQQEKEEVVADHFIFGTVVDIMLTGSKDEFDEKFVKIPDETKCSEAVKAIIDIVAGVVFQTETIDCPLESYREDILDACNYNNYQGNWKDDTRIDKIIKEGSEYFDLLKSIAGKTPITESEYAKALNCVMSLKSDEYTKQYVVAKGQPNVEFWDKFIIEFDYEGVQIKGELDRVVINHNTKKIIPIDFKTSGKPILSFPYEFLTYRYDFQAATYEKGLYEHPTVITLLRDGYHIENFLYIVVEKDLRSNPMVFEVTQDLIKLGYEGGETSRGLKYEGFKQAIERLQYAQENDAWLYPMEYYKQKGRLKLEL
jgi:hypothetical protein